MKKIKGELAALLTLASLLSPVGVSAASSTTASNSSNCNGANGQSQLGQYCGSAQSAQQGSDANSSLWKVWGGVATVCLHACFASAATGPLGTTGCTVESTGGAATEGVITKQYASSLTSIAASQSGQLANLTGKSSSAATSSTTDADKKIEAQKKAKKAACTAGIQASIKSINDFRDMQGQDQVAQQNKNNAQSLDSGTNGAISAAGSAGGKATSPSYPSGEGLGNGVAGASAATAGTLSSTCASARQTSSASETIQCAIGNDPTLPSSVGTQGFLNNFQQASGTGFGNFGNSGQGPADSIAQAAAGNISTADAVKVASVLKNLEGDLMNGAYAEVAPYTGNGGGGAGVAEDPSATDPANLVAGMMEQMQGKNNGAANAKTMDGPQAVVFANQNRAPAAIPQDRTLSLFDRVSYRYFYELKKMEAATGGKP